MGDFFNREMSQNYDERNRPLAAITEAMHFLIRLVMQDLPVQARVLCVGVGTGAEILSLAKTYPQWRFVGVDPSSAMLDVCRERLSQSGIIDRCELVHGYVQDLPKGIEFDGALSVLVGHFVKRDEKLDFFRNIHARLQPGGVFANTEISFDLDAETFPSMLKNWERVQILMGSTPEKLVNLPTQLREALSVLSWADNESLLQQAGFQNPVRFFQALMISGWFGKKA